MREILESINENTWIISDTHFGHANILSFEPCRLTQMRIDGYEADEHDQWIIDNWNTVVQPGSTVLHLGDFAFKPGFYTPKFNKCYEEKFKNVSSKEFKDMIKIIKPRSLDEIMHFLLSERKGASDGMNKDQFKSIISNYIPEQEYYQRYEDLLNGNIVLILGNHDPKPKQFLNRNIKVIDGFYHFSGDEFEILNKVQHPDPMFSGFVKQIGDKNYLFCHYALFNNDSWDLNNKMIAPRMKVLETIYKANGCDCNIHGHLHSNKSIFEDSINVCFEHLSYMPQKLKSLI